MTGSSLLPAGVLDIDGTFLPNGRMRQIARVTALDGPRIDGEVDLGEGHPVWPEHFPGDPIFPGTLMIEAAGQLVALWAWAQGHRGRPRLVRTGAEFTSPVVPGTPVLAVTAEVRRKRNLFVGDVRIAADGTEAARIEVLLVVLPPG